MKRWVRFDPSESPSEKVFRAYAQWETDKVFSRIRVGVIALATLWWVVGLGRVGSAWMPAVVVASWALALGDLYVVRFRPDLTRILPVWSAVGELFLIMLLMMALGPHRTTMEPLFLMAAAGDGIRIRAPWNWVVVVVCAVAAFPWVGPVLASYVAAMGLMQSIVSVAMVQHIRKGVRDSLTGLFGRDYALRQLDELMSRGTFPCSVAIADLDGFKRINDRFGHPVGDHVLVTTSRVLERHVRQEDLTARLGGDEFLLLFVGATAKEAEQIANRIRREIEAMNFASRTGGESLCLTLSIGIVEAFPGRTVHQILKDADTALYQAKANRNSVMLFTDSSPAAQAPA